MLNFSGARIFASKTSLTHPFASPSAGACTPTPPPLNDLHRSLTFYLLMWTINSSTAWTYVVDLGEKSCHFLTALMVCFKVKKEWSSGQFQLQPGDEDIHTANERRLKVSWTMHVIYVLCVSKNGPIWVDLYRQII